MKKSELQRLISEILVGQQQDVKAGDILKHKSSGRELKVIGKIQEGDDTILVCSATWSPTRLRVNLKDVGMDYDVVTNNINEGQHKQITNGKTILTEGVDEDKSKTFKHTHKITRTQWNEIYVKNRPVFDIHKAVEDLFSDNKQMFLMYERDGQHFATYDVDNSQLYTDIPKQYITELQDGLLELDEVVWEESSTDETEKWIPLNGMPIEPYVGMGIRFKHPDDGVTVTGEVVKLYGNNSADIYFTYITPDGRDESQDMNDVSWDSLANLNAEIRVDGTQETSLEEVFNFDKSINQKWYKKYPGLEAEANTFIYDFVILDQKYDPWVEGVVMFQLRFENGEFGLCIWDTKTKQFIEEPGTYEMYGTTIQKVADKYRFRHTDKITEDDYYEPQKRQVNQKDEVEKIVGDYLKMSGGEGSEDFYVRGNGTDIEYMSIPYTDKHGFKHKAGTMSKEDWEEVIDNLRIELEKNGYENFELNWISPTGFRMSQKNELDEDIKVGSTVKIGDKVYVRPELRKTGESGIVTKVEKPDNRGMINFTYKNSKGDEYSSNHMQIRKLNGDKIRNESITEVSSLKQETWSKSDIRDLLYLIGQDYIVYSNDIDSGNAAGDWGNIKFYPQSDKEMRLEFETPSIAQKAFDIFSNSITNPYEFESRFDIMPTTIMVKFTDNENLEESETMTTTDIWTNEEIESFLTSINQTQIIPNIHHEGTGISYGEYGTIKYDRIFNTLYLEFGSKEKKDLFTKSAKIPSKYEMSKRSDIMPMTIMIQVKK